MTDAGLYNCEHYIVQLITNAKNLPFDDGNHYILSVDLHNQSGRFIKRRNIKFYDEKRIYKNRLKSGTKWEIVCVPDINGRIKIKSSIDDKIRGEEIQNALLNPDNITFE